jgi:hypothetical protein
MHQLIFVSQVTTLGVIASASDLIILLQAVSQEEGSDHVKDLRRRVLKIIPRRLRKDAERIAVEQLPDLPRAVADWHAEEHRVADRVAMLFARDTVGVLRAVAGEDPRALRRHARALDLIRWLCHEQSWRVFQRLTS